MESFLQSMMEGWDMLHMKPGFCTLNNPILLYNKFFFSGFFLYFFITTSLQRIHSSFSQNLLSVYTVNLSCVTLMPRIWITRIRLSCIIPWYPAFCAITHRPFIPSALTFRTNMKEILADQNAGCSNGWPGSLLSPPLLVVILSKALLQWLTHAREHFVTFHIIVRLTLLFLHGK